MNENGFGPHNFDYWDCEVIKSAIEGNDLILTIRRGFTTGILKFVDIKDFNERNDIISKNIFCLQHRNLDDHYKLYRIQFIDESIMDIIAKNKAYTEN